MFPDSSNRMWDVLIDLRFSSGAIKIRHESATELLNRLPLGCQNSAGKLMQVFNHLIDLKS